MEFKTVILIDAVKQRIQSTVFTNEKELTALLGGYPIFAAYARQRDEILMTANGGDYGIQCMNMNIVSPMLAIVGKRDEHYRYTSAKTRIDQALAEIRFITFCPKEAI